MANERPRYAVYFVPAANSDLYQFGSAVLQYDCYSGEAVTAPSEFAGDRDDWRKVTQEPRRYGFHTTLKAPFYLSLSCTEASLVSAFSSFVNLGRASARFKPVVQMLGKFAALVPELPNTTLNALAADCTTIFDAFRAPMLPQERARRLAGQLNSSQIDNLDRWGYPYLFSDFQFHMTLTGEIAAANRDTALATLKTVFRRMCRDRDVIVDRLALMKQENPNANFQVLSHAPLQASPSP